MIELTPGGERLFNLMMQLPPDLPGIRAELEAGAFSPDELNAAALKFTDKCFDESMDHAFRENEARSSGGDYFSWDAVVVVGEHSTYLYDLVKLLLEFGLDPNAVVEGENIMPYVRYVENEYIAADNLALLLEHGGDCRLEVDGEDVFRMIDFDVVFDAFEQHCRRKYDSLVHCWFVLLGYGARLDNEEANVDVFLDRNTDEPFDLAKLKNHRSYTFGLSYTPCRGKKWSLHIFDKQTMWEVARL